MMRKRLICLVLLILLVSVPAQGVTQKITMEQAIEEAIAHNPEILKAGQEIHAAKAGFWGAISPENPELFTEYEGIPKDHHSLSGYGEKKIGFTQELEFPLTYYYRGQWYNFEKNSIKSEYLLLRNDVVDRVKKNFFKVLLLEKNRQLYEDIAQNTRNLYQKARIRVEAGESASYDTLKVKVDLAEVENQVLAITKEYEVSLYELKLLLGRKKEDLIEIEGNLMFSPVSLNQDSLKQVAVDNHPLLREAFAQVCQKEIEKSLSWLGLMPNIKVSYFHQEFPRELSPKAWGGEIGLSIPFWAFLKGQGKIREASHELEAAKWEVESKKNKVLLEIEKAYSKIIVAERQVQNYRENMLKDVDELVRIATRSYEEGEMSYLEITEAFRSMNRTKAGYHTALFEYLAAQSDLEMAVGISLW